MNVLHLIKLKTSGTVKLSGDNNSFNLSSAARLIDIGLLKSGRISLSNSLQSSLASDKIMATIEQNQTDLVRNQG